MLVFYYLRFLQENYTHYFLGLFTVFSYKDKHINTMFKFYILEFLGYLLIQYSKEK